MSSHNEHWSNGRGPAKSANHAKERIMMKETLNFIFSDLNQSNAASLSRCEVRWRISMTTGPQRSSLIAEGDRLEEGDTSHDTMEVSEEDLIGQTETYVDPH
jgi:hypothetical protein